MKIGKILLILGIYLPCFASFKTEDFSLEEKVGQLLMVQFHGEIANEDAKALAQDVKVGGFIYYNWANGLSSFEQVKNLSLSLQELVLKNRMPVPLLIALDQEGGIVARLKNGFTSFSGNKALGETKEPMLAEAAAVAIGKELRAVGVNMNLAPVVDVNSNAQNPVIGIRSFGDNVEEVIAFGKKALDGYSRAKIIATLKHFPGHGDTGLDSHQDLPIVDKSIEDLKKVELAPFTKLAPFADAIMTAHILVPAIDPIYCSTLSKKTLGLLREEIGFQGVIISDSLVMEGVLKGNRTVDEAAILALNAGCDLLILGGRLLEGQKAGFELKVKDIFRIHQSIVEAVKKGRIQETRINDAFQRVLDLKKRRLFVEEDVVQEIDFLEHQAIAQTIAKSALEIVSQQSELSLQDQKVIAFAPDLLKEPLEKTSLLQMGKSVEISFFSGLNPKEEEMKKAKSLANGADVIVIYSYNAWKNPSQRALIDSFIQLNKQVIVVVTRDPMDADLFSDANMIVKTFSPTVYSLEAVCHILP